MREYKSVLKNYFCEYIALCEKTLNNGTCLRKETSLTNFDRFLDRHSNTEVVTEDIINRWIESLRKKHENTVSYYISDLRNFLHYANASGLNAFIPDIPKRKDSFVPYIYSEAELARIFLEADNYIPVSKNAVTGIDYKLPMILRLLYSCGLRLGETLQLKVCNVDFVNSTLILKETKNKKQRFVPMDASMAKLIRKYCFAARIYDKPYAYLFPGNSPEKPIRIAAIEVHFRNILKKADIPVDTKNNRRGPCLHSFRHCFVLHSFRNVERAGLRLDDTLSYLSTYLGHKSLHETERYMKFAGELFKEDMKRFEDFSKTLFPEVNNEETTE